MYASLDGSTDGYAGRIEVLEGRSGRRFRSEAERARIAAESMMPGALALPAETADEPMFAALVVEVKPDRPAPGPKRRGGAARSGRIEMVVEGVKVHVPPDIDEALLTRLIHAIRMASR